MCFAQNFFDRKKTEAIFDVAFAEVKRIENKFTDFYPSEFNTINDFAGIKPCPVDNEIFDLIKSSIQISEESEGTFDISYASIGHKWREAKKKGTLLSDKERLKYKQLVDYKKIILNEDVKTVFLPDKEMRIGLGGIGKGYAVDRAYIKLLESGINNFYINGSGDIRVHSSASAPRKWKIGIRNPFSEDRSQNVGVVQLANGAVATSGGYIQKNESVNGNPDHHVINIKTGYSNNQIISATIFADNCVIADTVGTIILSLNSDEALAYLNKRNILGAFIEYSGKTVLSNRALAAFG